MDSNENSQLSVLERVESLFDDDDDFVYEEVEECLSISSNHEDELISEALKVNSFSESEANVSKCNDATYMTEQYIPLTQIRPCVPEDFIRNFLIKTEETAFDNILSGMMCSLDAFDTEWYEFQLTGRISNENQQCIPDIYICNHILSEEIVSLKKKVQEMTQVAKKAKGMRDKFRKERDFHKRNHHQVVQEKNRLLREMHRMNERYEAVEPTIEEFQKRYQVALKEKMLIKLQLDRCKSQLEILKHESISKTNIEHAYEVSKESTQCSSVCMETNKSSLESNRDTKFVSYKRRHEFDVSVATSRVNTFTLKKTFDGHASSVTALSTNPRGDLIASASDDKTWKIWSLPDCDNLSTGNGHTSWIADVTIHENYVSTCSGDSSIKVWNLSNQSPKSTLCGHTKVVWGVSFHPTGDFLASCGMDQTVRLWDVNSERCRTTLRGHIESVNCIAWLPYSWNICSGSMDKTVSIWDVRTALCAKTFYGHSNTVRSVCVDNREQIVVSADADGFIRLWDMRTVSERSSLKLCNSSINKICMDQAGKRLVAGCSDGIVKILDISGAALNCTAELKGHEKSVQAVILVPDRDILLSAGSDGMVKLWS